MVNRKNRLTMTYLILSALIVSAFCLGQAYPFHIVGWHVRMQSAEISELIALTNESARLKFETERLKFRAHDIGAELECVRLGTDAKRGDHGPITSVFETLGCCWNDGGVEPAGC